ncbi:MAG TPA: hypothetical protein VEC04_07490 [Brevundimonas sp.]|nr:hypothetical protein [Brevundimonas sp.]
MYWNCTAPVGTSSFDKAKLAIIAGRVAQVKPDILCLDEVSVKVASVAAAAAWAASMGLKGYTAKVVSLNPGSHLNMILFHGPELSKCKSEEGIPDPDWGGDKTKRNLIRSTWIDPKTARPLSVWFLHANASAVGGKTAVELALAAMADTSSIFMGDFNNGLAAATDEAKAAKAFAVSPVARTAKAAAYSQWSRGLTPAQSDPAYKIAGTTYDFKPNSQGCIDFALGRNLIAATAVDALAGLDANGYGQLMMNVDHIPIAYDVLAA